MVDDVDLSAVRYSPAAKPIIRDTATAVRQAGVRSSPPGAAFVAVHDRERPVPRWRATRSVITAELHSQADAAPAPAQASQARFPPRLVLALLLAGGGFVGWIIVLAIRLPAQYRADHWNVAWVGFDVMLLVSLVVSAWALARRPHLAPTAFAVTAVLLACDAWFDVTTASGTGDTAVSMVSAASIELPLAGAMAWAACRRLRTNSSAPYPRMPPRNVGTPESSDSR
jgi:hypothetical protein